MGLGHEASSRLGQQGPLRSVSSPRLLLALWKPFQYKVAGKPGGQWQKWSIPRTTVISGKVSIGLGGWNSASATYTQMVWPGGSDTTRGTVPLRKASVFHICIQKFLRLPMKCPCLPLRGSFSTCLSSTFQVFRSYGVLSDCGNFWRKDLPSLAIVRSRLCEDAYCQ